jgi:hypothetical protein
MTVSLSTALAAYSSSSSSSSSSISRDALSLLTFAGAKARQLQGGLSNTQHHKDVTRELVDLAGDSYTRMLMNAADVGRESAAFDRELVAAAAPESADGVAETAESDVPTAAVTDASGAGTGGLTAFQRRIRPWMSLDTPAAAPRANGILQFSGPHPVEPEEMRRMRRCGRPWCTTWGCATPVAPGAVQQT